MVTIYWPCIIFWAKAITRDPLTSEGRSLKAGRLCCKLEVMARNSCKRSAPAFACFHTGSCSVSFRLLELCCVPVQDAPGTEALSLQEIGGNDSRRLWRLAPVHLAMQLTGAPAARVPSHHPHPALQDTPQCFEELPRFWIPQGRYLPCCDLGGV